MAKVNLEVMNQQLCEGRRVDDSAIDDMLFQSAINSSLRERSLINDAELKMLIDFGYRELLQEMRAQGTGTCNSVAVFSENAAAILARHNLEGVEKRSEFYTPIPETCDVKTPLDQRVPTPEELIKTYEKMALNGNAVILFNLGDKSDEVKEYLKRYQDLEKPFTEHPSLEGSWRLRVFEGRGVFEGRLSHSDPDTFELSRVHLSDEEREASEATTVTLIPMEQTRAEPRPRMHVIFREIGDKMCIDDVQRPVPVPFRTTPQTNYVIITNGDLNEPPFLPNYCYSRKDPIIIDVSKEDWEDEFFRQVAQSLVSHERAIAEILYSTCKRSYD